MGNLKTITYPNGTIAEYTYDTLNRLTYLENRTSDGMIISSYTYTLDAAGNRTRVVEHTGRTVDYAYDAMDKLLKETITEPGGTTSVTTYTYDAAGNRLTKTANGVTITYTYDANNRLLQDGAISYQYDSNGNLSRKDSSEEQVVYAYNGENRLVRVETTRQGVTIVVAYAYDVDGNRVQKTIDGLVTINYLVDTNRDYAQVLEERDGTGNLIVRYVYGDDLISQTRGGVTSYYHYDGLGSTRALSNSSAVIMDTYTYDAFGNLSERTGATTNDYLFTGEQFDANLGFYYLRARYMQPATGRFITMDEFAGVLHDPYSLHKYLYASANPVNKVDPSGYSEELMEQETTVLGMNILSKIQFPLTKNVLTILQNTRVFVNLLASYQSGAGSVGVGVEVVFNPFKVLLYTVISSLAHELLEMHKDATDPTKAALKQIRRVIKEATKDTEDPNDVWLWRVGGRPETVDDLHKKATDAKTKLEEHLYGVSTWEVGTEEPVDRPRAKLSHVKIFFPETQQTTRLPKHYTVVFYEPVDLIQADIFNYLFRKNIETRKPTVILN